eukprot:Selendium_serpulae@DN6014_c0_g1_i6.p1
MCCADKKSNQNEINATTKIINRAVDRGATVVYNPAPITADIKTVPVGRCSLIIVNETEACLLSDAPMSYWPELNEWQLALKVPTTASISAFWMFPFVPGIRTMLFSPLLLSSITIAPPLACAGSLAAVAVSR